MCSGIRTRYAVESYLGFAFSPVLVLSYYARAKIQIIYDTSVRTMYPNYRHKRRLRIAPVSPGPRAGPMAIKI
jgi:hypothetical protein